METYKIILSNNIVVDNSNYNSQYTQKIIKMYLNLKLYIKNIDFFKYNQAKMEQSLLPQPARRLPESSADNSNPLCTGHNPNS